jgi:hypothetical protein
MWGANLMIGDGRAASATDVDHNAEDAMLAMCTLFVRHNTDRSASGNCMLLRQAHDHMEEERLLYKSCARVQVQPMSSTTSLGIL